MGEQNSLARVSDADKIAAKADKNEGEAGETMEPRVYSNIMLKMIIEQVSHEEGLTVEQALSGTGLRFSELEQDGALSTLSDNIAVYERIAELSRTPGFGLRSRAARQFDVQSPVVPLMLACRTVGEAFAKLVTYIGTANPFVRYRVEILNEEVLLIADNPIQLSPRAQIIVTEETLATWRFLNVPLHEIYKYGKEIWINHPKPAHSFAYQMLFPCPVLFGKPKLAAVLPARIVNEPLPRYHPELMSILEERCKALTARLNNPNATAMVHQYFDETPPHLWHSLGAASMACLSDRSMRRKLAVEGTSFGSILRERRTILIKQLKAGGADSKQIADTLGYANTQDLKRAFMDALSD